MNLNISELNIKILTDLVTSASPNFRLLSWPPARDWPVVFDKDGVVISRWGDPIWDLSLWAGSRTILDFGDGKKGKATRLDSENADLLRLVATWLIWGPRAHGAVSSVKVSFSYVRQIVDLCSRNGISADKLMRFPKVLDQVPSVLPKAKYEQVISLLHRIYDSRDGLGFTIVSQEGLRRLASVAPKHEFVQTPYIPPRIWLYQVKRLHECMKEFLANKDKVDGCFRYCLDAYVMAYGSLEASLASGKSKKSPGPFNADCRNYVGTFPEVAERFGIADLLKKWLARDSLRPGDLSAYFSLVTFAGLAYIGNFTLQRKEEISSLRTDCLYWEEDERLGPVPIICGETTKTDRDSDARWVASPSVEVAVQAVSAIAHLRMICDRANPLISPTPADQATPYLDSTPTEPWGSASGQVGAYHIRVKLMDFRHAMMRHYTDLFDHEVMRIRSEDLEVARRLTPNLPEDEFGVGKVWPLAWHQYRRTGAVNMFASGLISDSSMQQQMKHSSRLMPLYYGRNHSRLHLNKEVAAAVVMAMYEAQVKVLKTVVGEDRFISPHSPERRDQLTVQILSAKETKELISMTKKGAVAFREHRLGGCMKAGVCEYGGIESVARCAGGDVGKPCIDVLYDRRKEPQVRADMRRVIEEISMLGPEHPRHKALVVERQAMENYLNVVANG